MDEGQWRGCHQRPTAARAKDVGVGVVPALPMRGCGGSCPATAHETRRGPRYGSSPSPPSPPPSPATRTHAFAACLCVPMRRPFKARGTSCSTKSTKCSKAGSSGWRSKRPRPGAGAATGTRTATGGVVEVPAAWASVRCRLPLAGAGVGAVIARGRCPLLRLLASPWTRTGMVGQAYLTWVGPWHPWAAHLPPPRPGTRAGDSQQYPRRNT